MSTERQKRSSYQFLQSMRTEELEQLLTQETFAGETVDAAYIEAIMGVMDDREKEEGMTVVHEAWKDFRENYIGHEDAYLDDIAQEPDLDHLNRSSKKKLPVLRIAAIAAAVTVLLCGTASALNLNVWQVFVNWTADVFGFEAPYADVTGKNAAEDVFRQLRIVVEKETDIPVVPNWAPDGTTAVENISVADTSKGIRFRGDYEVDGRGFTIRIVIYNMPPADYTVKYQKDDIDVQTVDINGVLHYIASNRDNVGVTWINDRVEGSIQGELSQEDLEQMVTSIYEE